jgi:gamma-glutamyltranspeptidase/glutathione hydrolase
MTTRWHIGAMQLRGAIAPYAKRFDLLEVRATVSPKEEGGGEGAIAPTLATLRRWRKSVPPHFTFAVVLGPHAGRVKPGAALDQEVDAARRAADALQARCIVLRTPAEVTPAAVWRERIAKVIAKIPRDVIHFVWEPAGLWELDDAAAQARAWGVVLAVDPARERVPARARRLPPGALPRGDPVAGAGRSRAHRRGRLRRARGVRDPRDGFGRLGGQAPPCARSRRPVGAGAEPPGPSAGGRHRRAGRRAGMKAAAASQTHVAQAAREALSGGNAVDAVVAGVLEAAAVSPGVLLGPVQILAGGTGAGLVAIDGRVRQPGLEAPRPRGFVAGEAVPEAARVGAPAMPSALATALAMLGTATLAQAARAAAKQASAASPERAAVLKALARHGAPALSTEPVATEIVHAAGRAARGLLTVADLAAPRPDVVRRQERELTPRGLFAAPWAAEGENGSTTHVVIAADGRGMVAAAAYEDVSEGLAIPALGLIAPRFAAPVMRGQVRVRPGQPLPACAPVVLRVEGGVVDLGLGVALLASAPQALSSLVEAVGASATVVEALERTKGGRPVALAVSARSARVLASA